MGEVVGVMTTDSLGDRMKGYEQACRTTLPLRLPVIIRVDGKAFHRWTRLFDKPFDNYLIELMNFVALELCEHIQGTRLAYVQSDEISLLLHNYATLNTSAWFDNQVQKMVSVAAAIASAAMTSHSGRVAHFDARAFVLPEAEVCNYFIWRQQDWTRNSIQMLAGSLYSHNQLNGKDQKTMQDMIHQAGHNWNDLPNLLKRGRCVFRETLEQEPGVVRRLWCVDENIPVFTQDRQYIEKFLAEH
jgi:tRNA(His) guanylyltransferase